MRPPIKPNKLIDPTWNQVLVLKAGVADDLRPVTRENLILLIGTLKSMVATDHAKVVICRDFEQGTVILFTWSGTETVVHTWDDWDLSGQNRLVTSPAGRIYGIEGRTMFGDPK